MDIDMNLFGTYIGSTHKSEKNIGEAPSEERVHPEGYQKYKAPGDEAVTPRDTSRMRPHVNKMSPQGISKV